MEFNKAYNRAAFLEFLKGSFLPEEDFTKEETVLNFPVQTKYCTKATRLGSCHDTLDLEVYEILHTSKHDARVGLSKEAFRLLAEQGCTRALVLFVPQDDNSNYRFSLITIKLFVDENGKVHKKYSNLRRYSYLFGTDFKSEKTLKKYFLKQKTNDENIKRVIDENDLLERFSVEALAKDFYEKLYQWYLWAVDESTGVTFPNKTSTSDDDRDNMNIKIIRMITRLLFVWFIKQKGLVPNEIFEIEKLKNILKDFNPESKDNGNYYNAILQNLFFATLNRAIIDDEGNPRRFANRKDKRDMRNLYRYAEMFNISEDEVLDLFAKIPFLNGGLFECLDKFKKTEIQQNEDVYYDGFSRNAERSANGNLKYRAFVPNILFFNEDEQQPGLINLFSQYNFTIEENSVNDADVSLDPELLGRVFENLLAAYNPETQESARKATGSFYTPREIVNYMVSESLIAHVSQHCNDIGKQKIRKLFEDNEKSDDWTEQQSTEVIQTLKGMKILDPACGSGAFPMGCLLRIVEIIECLQGHAENRYELKLHLIDNCIFGIDIQPIAMLISKLRFFISLICEQKDINFNSPETNYGINTLPNLETKFVAANTLIGADIRNYGDDWTNDEKLQQMQKELLSIRSNHFYARSQYKKEKDREADAAKCDEILSYIIENKSKPNEVKISLLETQIKKYNEELKQYEGEHWVDEYTQIGDLFEKPQPSLFHHDANKEKRDSIKKAISNCEAEIIKEKNKNQLKGFEAAVKQVTNWNPYNQNASSPFFDPEWMFGVKDGFDIVIGNPPYRRIQGIRKDDPKFADFLVNTYKSATGKFDLYVTFVDKGLMLCTSKGILNFVMPTKWTNSDYGIGLRNIMLKECMYIKMINFSSFQVFNASTYTGLQWFIKSSNCNMDYLQLSQDVITPQDLNNFLLNINIEYFTNYQLSNFSSKSWKLSSNKSSSDVLDKFSEMPKLKTFLNCISQGTVTVGDDIFVMEGHFEGDSFIGFSDEIKKEINIEKTIMKPLLKGEDVKRYSPSECTHYIIYPHHEVNGKTIPYTESEMQSLFPKTYSYLVLFKDKLIQKKIRYKTNPTYWYSLHRSREISMFENRKIITPEISMGCNMTLDAKGLYHNTQIYTILPSYNYVKFIACLLGILNSKIFWFYISNTGTVLRGGFFRFKTKYLEDFPIPMLNDIPQKHIEDLEGLVNTILKIKRTDILADTTIYENEIDKIVYKLYGLTYDEVKIVDPETPITKEKYDEA
jgi:hypothetical protein